MSFIYVTGIAGAGKSAVCNELKNKGYETHEGDDGLSAFYDNATGVMVARPIDVAERTTEWRSRNTWKMSRDKLQELKNKAGAKPVFVCGVSSNEDEYLDLFDKVFALMIDTATLKLRINDRDDNSFGKLPHEMDTILEWQEGVEDHYRRVGAFMIDAKKPLTEVVDEILGEVSAAGSTPTA
jgi:broad-specificity NMP kinase